MSRAEYHREWKKKNPEKVRASRARWYQKHKANHALWRRENPEKVQTHRKKARLKKLYGLKLEDWNQMFSDQKGKCAICQIRLASEVDHCHKTGKVRGLLCGPCNRAMGMIGDNPTVLRQAASYLEK